MGGAGESGGGKMETTILEQQLKKNRKCVHSPESVQARDSFSDSSLEPRPLTLKAIF